MADTPNPISFTQWQLYERRFTSSDISIYKKETRSEVVVGKPYFSKTKEEDVNGFNIHSGHIFFL